MQERYILFYNIADRGLDTMAHLLNKAKEFSVTDGIGEEEILESKLAPDMFNFKKQVQVFTDGVVGGVYRLAGLAKPTLADTESTIDELLLRVEAARTHLSQVDPKSVAGIEARRISLPWMGGKYFEADEYLDKFLFANNLFHLSVAYSILRVKGVSLGKADYLGSLEMKG